MNTKPQIEGVEFKPATGGLVSETSMRTPGRDGLSFKRETAIHPSLAHAAAHLRRTLGSKFGKVKGMSGGGNLGLRGD